MYAALNELGQAGQWAVLWLQLPVLMLIVAAVAVTIVAMRKARQEDIPTMFKDFIGGFGRRQPPGPALPESESPGQPNAKPGQDDQPEEAR